MPIRLITFTAETARRIELYASAGASSVELAHGTGESHAYVIHFSAGGRIGPHPAGFDQLFLVIEGSGWVEDSNGVRHAVGTRQGAFVPKGEVHAKGSESGLVAVMMQSSRFDVPGVQDWPEDGI